MLIDFKDMAAVEEQANRVIQNILSDKSYINPEKFDNVLRQYEKRQAKLDAEASAAIKNQIQNINAAKKTIEQASKSMMESKQKIEQINFLWKKDQKFHQAYPQIRKLYLYQKNLGTVIQQLRHFINLQAELKNINTLLQDDNNYEQAHDRILNLADLRDNVMTKLQNEKSSKDLSVIKREFEEVEKVEQRFYGMVFDKFRNCIKLAKSNPVVLIGAVKVIEKGDYVLELKKQPKYMKDKALGIINDSIDQRFKQELGEKKQIVDIIQNAKFVSQDLVQVLDKVSRCFPTSYNIFQWYQSRYQANVVKIIMPHLQTLTQQKQYGNLLILMNWIEDYEAVLERAGVQSLSFLQLKTKVKELMPLFIDHNQKLLGDYIRNCVNTDRNNFNRDFYQELISNKSEFVSNYPSDIFIFVNKEAEIIKQQVRGELFIEFVRCLATQLNFFQQSFVADLQEKYEQRVKTCNNESKVVDFEYELLLNLNNFNECLKHASEAKQEYAETVTEQYKDRVNKIFLNEVQKPFNMAIPIFVNLITNVIYLDLNKEFIPDLFTVKWIQEVKGKRAQLIESVVASDVQSLINNPVNFRLIVKACYDYLVDIYSQQLVFSVKTTYGISLAGWEPRRLDLKVSNQFYDRKNNNRRVLTKQILQDNILKDTEIIVKHAQQMSMYLNKTYLTKLQQRLTVLRELFTKTKMEFETVLEPLLANFNEQAENLIEATLCVREELDRSMPSKLEDVISKRK